MPDQEEARSSIEVKMVKLKSTQGAAITAPSRMSEWERQVNTLKQTINEDDEPIASGVVGRDTE